MSYFQPNIGKEKIKGYITRARIQWLDQGEKPTSFFCKLESKQFTEKTIRKLQHKKLRDISLELEYNGLTKAKSLLLSSVN